MHDEPHGSGRLAASHVQDQWSAGFPVILKTQLPDLRIEGNQDPPCLRIHSPQLQNMKPGVPNWWVSQLGFKPQLPHFIED